MQRLDDFMGDALARYYHNRDPLGTRGDFTTAPEISQLFGETLGVWAAQQWMRMGSPQAFRLIELGPGRGTLMNDLLRATKHIPGFHPSLSLHMVETSPVLREKQKKTLSRHCEDQRDEAIYSDSHLNRMDCFGRKLPRNDENKIPVQWHNHLSDIPTDLPIILIANEFFDALPVRQFQYIKGEWQEHYIRDHHSVWTACQKKPPFKNTLPPPEDNDIFEYSEMQELYANIMTHYHGAALIIDYGYGNSTYGDSLQALYKHATCDITDHIGEADITTHIDFQWLATFFGTTRLSTQARFLKDNGIDIRYQALNSPSLASGYDRLISPHQMGELFKAFEIQLP